MFRFAPIDIHDAYLIGNLFQNKYQQNPPSLLEQDKRMVPCSNTNMEYPIKK
jgi:hypothetical protein